MKTMKAMTPIDMTSTADDDPRRDRALTPEFERIDDRRRESATMPAKMISEDAVADAARGDLLAKPHQEHGAAHEGQNRRDPEEPAWLGDDARLALKPDGYAVGLEGGEHHRQVARVLIDDLAAGLAFLLQGLECRNTEVSS